MIIASYKFDIDVLPREPAAFKMAFRSCKKEHPCAVNAPAIIRKILESVAAFFDPTD
jgi:hypothetical protein